MSPIGKLRFALRHPAVARQPARFFARLAVWRLLTLIRRGATVKLPRSDMSFWCPPEWRGVAKLAYTMRDDYEPELAHLHRWVKPGDLVLDVGAHYGSYTLPLARLAGDGGSVLAFEPSSHARGVLLHNLEINDVRNVEVLPLALGEQESRGLLHVHADRSRASLAALGGETVGTEAVRVARLDDVVPASRRVSFMKIDIEGYELLALRGASAMLDRDNPVVLFEELSALAGRAGLPPRGAWELLEAHGYEMHTVGNDGELLALAQPPDSVAHANVVAIHPG